MVREDPRRAGEQPYKAVVEGDREWLMDVYAHVPELIKGVTEAFGGITTGAFDAAARDFFASVVHPTLGRPYTQVAYRPMRELIDFLGANDFRVYICTGGGPGIMEAANRGAQEAGAPSVALNIALPHEQHPNPYVTPSLSFKFHYFALRKMHFMMRAKALVAFPGGFGTLDELFEVMTLVQTRKARQVPILLFGSDYWQRLINMEVLVEEGTISREDLQLFRYVDTPEDAWKAICDFYQLDVPAA
jgi:uncharacterized protein (TIGR00730 family)